MKTLFLVAGARPNFMKIAPIVRALQARGGLAFKIIHTDQHYDRDMNDVFFEELGIPAPDVFMAAGGGSQAQQTAKIMVDEGSNVPAGAQPERIVAEAKKVLASNGKRGRRLALRDGKAAQRIVAVLSEALER